MREIKFRGKRVDNGEWVYGNPVEWLNETNDISIVAHPFGCCIDHEGNLVLIEAPFVCKVIPETVGQFTGLKDKNGVEIYEGDVCNCREYECFGKIKWNKDDVSFYFLVVMEGGGFEEEYLYEYAGELAVIGNIHENPELLEVQP